MRERQPNFGEQPEEQPSDQLPLETEGGVGTPKKVEQLENIEIKPASLQEAVESEDIGQLKTFRKNVEALKQQEKELEVEEKSREQKPGDRTWFSGGKRFLHSVIAVGALSAPFLTGCSQPNPEVQRTRAEKKEAERPARGVEPIDSQKTLKDLMEKTAKMREIQNEISDMKGKLQEIRWRINQNRFSEQQQEVQKKEIDKVMPVVRAGEATDIAKFTGSKVSVLPGGNNFMFDLGRRGSYKVKQENVRDIIGDSIEYDDVVPRVEKSPNLSSSSKTIIQQAGKNLFLRKKESMPAKKGFELSGEIKNFKVPYVKNSIINNGNVIRKGDDSKEDFKNPLANKEFNELLKKSREDYVKDFPDIIRECSVEEINNGRAYAIDFGPFGSYEINKDDLENLIPKLRGIAAESHRLSILYSNKTKKWAVGLPQGTETIVIDQERNANMVKIIAEKGNVTRPPIRSSDEVLKIQRLISDIEKALIYEGKIPNGAEIKKIKEAIDKLP